MTEANFQNKPSLSQEFIVSREFAHFFSTIKYQTDAQRFIEYDPSQGIWIETPRQRLIERIQRFVVTRPVLCTPSSTTISFYERVVRALEVHMACKVVQTPGVMTESGFLNYKTKTIEPPTPNLFCFNRINEHLQNGRPMQCMSKQFLATLCNHTQIQAFVLREWLKNALIGENANQVAMHLVGIPGCGKSKFAELLFSILGEEACTVEIHNISAQFGLGPIVGKKLIVVPDPPVDGLNTKRASILRMLISGEAPSTGL